MSHHGQLDGRRGSRGLGAQPAVNVDTGEQRPQAIGGLVPRNRRFQATGQLGRSRFDAPNARRSRAGFVQTQRSEYRTAQVVEQMQGFEQLATPNLGRRVVHSNPKAPLHPAGVRRRILRHASRYRLLHPRIALPQHCRILDPLGQVRQHDELQVDVQQRLFI